MLSRAAECDHEASTLLLIDSGAGLEECSGAQCRHIGRIARLGQAGLFSTEVKAQIQSVQSRVSTKSSGR